MTIPATVFENVLRKSEPLMSTAPPDVMDHLRAARPYQVRERAWLVMYYSIILNTASSTPILGTRTQGTLLPDYLAASMLPVYSIVDSVLRYPLQWQK